ncbi:MAG: hypothetical protein KUG81_08105 [Gammaproteobacteria bacterium]|nr:hypothetical protein [Gammaproteobacteria bacterium]
MENVNHFFVDRSRRYLRDLISHLLENSDAVIFLEGARGSGRTSFLHWLESLNDSSIVKLKPRIIDDIDLLDDEQWQHLSEALSNHRHLITGQPGSYNELKKRGYFSSHTIERITIPPFTQEDADSFLKQCCPSLSELTRNHLIHHCRLYPGDLLQATYNTELLHSGLNRKRTKLWLILAAVLSIFAWVFNLSDNQTLPGTDLQPNDTEVTAIIRDTPQNPRFSILDHIDTPDPSSTPIDPAPAEPPTPKPELIPAERVAQLPPPSLDTAQPTTQAAKSTLASAEQLDRQQLLAANPNHFTLQLMLATDIDNIDQLVADYQLGDANFRYSKTIYGQTHYCLLYGIYKSLEDAAIALSALPKPIQQLGPFRKSLSAIHQELQSQSID